MNLAGKSLPAKFARNFCSQGPTKSTQNEGQTEKTQRKTGITTDVTIRDARVSFLYGTVLYVIRIIIPPHQTITDIVLYLVDMCNT